MDKKAQREHAIAHLNPKVRRNLRLFGIIALALLIAVVFEAVHYRANFLEVVGALAIGMLCGMAFARMYKFSWDTGAGHVTGNIDKYGVIVLVLYVLFDLMRGRLAGALSHSQAVPAISLALLAGAMYGRVIGSGRIIMRILREQEVLTRKHRH